MIVYGSSVSPYVRKVVAFAAEKGLEIKVKGVTLGSQDPGFREASPFAKMPALPRPGGGCGGSRPGGREGSSAGRLIQGSRHSSIRC
jgi:hypothetical protein